MTKEDEHYAEKAIELTKLAAAFFDEAQEYADDIKDVDLRNKTLDKLKQIIEEVV
jgi:hypothetical protein